jgi:fibronectin type 3 domain-containing protein
VSRREQGINKDAIAGETPITAGSALIDRSFEWEKTYSYRATIVTYVTQGSGEQQVEGDDTPTVTVFAHDVFPPAAPAGLQAVFSGPGQKLFIDLVWTPNSDSGLAGYNVYRHEQGTEPVKINSDLIKAPAFRDPDIVTGREYFYSVTAVDARGNESPHSPEAGETVP